MGNKGAVAIGFKIGSRTFMFVNSHFAAHQEKVAERNASFARVNHEIRMMGCGDDGKAVETPKSPAVFSMGINHLQIIF